MPGVTDLCNDALSQISEAPITAIDDGSIAANWCTRFYPTLRDDLLRGHTWGFAKKRATLAAGTTPLFDWTYAFTLPADCLRVMQFGTDDSVAWKIEGRTIVTMVSSASILYIQRVTDLNTWDAMAYQALATRLASKLATAIRHDGKLAESLYKLSQALVLDAQAVDGQEGTQTAINVDDLTSLR